MTQEIRRPCPGCGQVMNVGELHRHRVPCKIAQVKPGMRFRVNARTRMGGANARNPRRPIEVEILARSGTGWIARSVKSGNILHLKSYQRLLDWDEFAPGLTQNGNG